MNASSPEITITGSGPGGTAWVKQSSVDASSFAFLIGAGFKFNVGNKIILLTNLDYTATNPEFKNVELITSLGERAVSTWSQGIPSINLGLGIALKI